MAHIKELIQQHVGSAPILKALIQKMGFIEIIDRTLPLPARREGPTHGEAVAALVVALTQGICQLYRVEQFATEDDFLTTLFPHDAPKVWHDDHLGDTLDAIWAYGVGALQGAVTAHLVRSFDVSVDQLHYDTTSFKVYGAYQEDEEARGPAGGNEPLRLTFGHSKDHRPDLKQVKGGVGVSADGGVVLLFEGQDGNQADVSTSVDYWLKLKAAVGRTDFLFVGDCKLAAHDTLITIMRHGGRFLAPWPRYAEVQKKLEEWVLTNTVEERIPRRTAQGREVWYRGFQREQVLVDEEGREYPCVIHILFSPRLQAERQAAVERHIAKTQMFLAGLPKKLGKRGWHSQEAIEQAIDAILKRDQTGEFLSYRVIGTVENTKRYQGRGRPSPEAPYEEVTRSRWAVDYHWREEEINKAKLLGGYFPLITNDAELTTQQTLTAYKEQYQPELRFTWLKGAGIFAPVLLKTPKRIEAFFFVVGLVLQLLTLIERQAARQIAQRGEPVRGLKPNNLKDSRPKTEAILEAFRKVTVTHVVFADQAAEIVLSPLSPLQRCLLQV